MPTVSFEESMELGAVAGQACTAEEATGGATAMDVEEPGAEEPASEEIASQAAASQPGASQPGVYASMGVLFLAVYKNA